MKIKSDIEQSLPHGKCSKICYHYMSSYFISSSKVPHIETQHCTMLNLEGTVETTLVCHRKKLRYRDGEEFISCKGPTGKKKKKMPSHRCGSFSHLPRPGRTTLVSHCDLIGNKKSFSYKWL